jgi:hypothetical protein
MTHTLIEVAQIRQQLAILRKGQQRHRNEVTFELGLKNKNEITEYEFCNRIYTYKLTSVAN